MEFASSIMIRDFVGEYMGDFMVRFIGEFVGNSWVVEFTS